MPRWRETQFTTVKEALGVCKRLGVETWPLTRSGFTGFRTHTLTVAQRNEGGPVLEMDQYWLHKRLVTGPWLRGSMPSPLHEAPPLIEGRLTVYKDGDIFYEYLETDEGEHLSRVLLGSSLGQSQSTVPYKR